jgi:peptidoglycan/xylan/chitin deacetylase (PgdA/CDA1 family)
MAAAKPLIVHIVLNLEAWSFDEPLPRKLISSPHGGDAVPDLPNFSWVEYGMRAGLPRLLRELSGRQLPVSVSINAAVLDVYPGVGERLTGLGWELVGHGYKQRSLHDEASEESIIQAALDRIAALTGARPRGWLGPGTQETFLTPDLLASLGVEYTLDWTIDDLPLWLRTASRPVLAIPYTLDLNDSVLWAAHHSGSDELHNRVLATLSTFDVELPESPRILTLALHPHLVGVPHRFTYLRQTLDVLQERTDAVFATGGQICDWYAATERPDGR